MSQSPTTAKELAAVIAETVTPILQSYEIEALLAEGWIKCVMDLERKWAEIVALALMGDDPGALESLPRARWLRAKARQLVKTPEVYASEELYDKGE